MLVTYVPTLTQHWHSLDRHIMFIESIFGKATATVEIYKTPEGPCRVQAYLCNLWVEEKVRRGGLGRVLIAEAEKIAKENGQNSLFLEHDNRDTPDWVLEWYARLGYDVRAFNKTRTLMEKKLY